MLLAVSPVAFSQGATVVEIGSGTLDFDRTQGPRWTRVNVDPLIAGSHTIRVSWNNDADIRFSLFQMLSAPAPNDKVLIATTSNAAAVHEWTGTLDVSEQYYLGIWAASGSATFTATLEAETVAGDPLEFATQPAELTVIEGEDAIFTVAATGSGPLSYQWFDGTTAINGAISDTLTISPATLADSGTFYSVVVSDDNGSITSHAATLTVNGGVVLPVTGVNIGEGTLDSASGVGPRWVRVDFDSLAAGIHTIAVSWDSDANVRFNVFETDGTRISSSAVQGVNPGIWAGELNANEQYYIGLWSSNGIANYSAAIEANVPLSIESPPADLTVTEGEDATFTVVASGSGTLSYQWFASTTETLDDNTFIINPATEIPSATSDTLVISSVTLADSLSSYSVVVSDENGSVPSDIAILTVEEAEVTAAITDQPAELTLIEGEDAIFTVTATGSGTLGYQWFADTTAINGAISNTLTISPATLTDSGTAYSVVISDDNGLLTSDAATLTVNEIPVVLTIAAHPVDLAVTEGEDAIFTVVAAGSGTLSYQWFANTTAIADATGDTLIISPAALADTGTAYSVVVSDENASIDSNIAILVVLEDIVLPISVVTIEQGTLDSSSGVGPRWVRLNFDSLATAIHTITVSWDSDADVRFNVFEANGTRISNAVIQGSNPGVWAGELNENEQYYIALWSNEGIANYTATIEASVPVLIDSQPNDLVVTEGEDATFTVAATGSGPFSYQWFADGVALSGETADYLTVFATSLADNGTEYTVEVSNGVEAITSSIATLTVNEPVVLGLFSQEADTSAWMLHGPAPTLDFQAAEDTLAWGRVLLRIGDILLWAGTSKVSSRLAVGQSLTGPGLQPSALSQVSQCPHSKCLFRWTVLFERWFSHQAASRCTSEAILVCWFWMQQRVRSTSMSA